ncbi:hypothetical protein V2W45_1398883 [Cenococcum geophilum]
MEAYSDNSDKDQRYSRITFCNLFFNGLRSLAEATNWVKSGPEIRQNNLMLWDNRARCFFHEIAHLDYFMNAPASSPPTDDLQITYKHKDGRYTGGAYKPYNCKVLRNWQSSGWFPQRNADSFAFYAMAMWATKEIGRYPYLPRAGTKPPESRPRDSNGNPMLFDDENPDHGDREGDQDIDNVLNGTAEDSFPLPGCPDRDIGHAAEVALDPAPVPELDCGNDASSIPSTIFSSDTNRVY